MDPEQPANNGTNTGNAPADPSVNVGGTSFNSGDFKPDFSKPDFNKLPIGSVLGRAFDLLKKNPGLFIGMMVVAAIIPILLTIVAYAVPIFAFLVSPINFVITTVMQGAMAFAVYQVLTGHETSIGDAIKRGLSRLVTLIIAAILTGVGIGIGMIILIVPGIFLLLCWFVTIPVAAIEGLGAIDSIKRSMELTKGYRWNILAIIIIVGIITGIIAGIAAAIFMGILGMLIGSIIVSLVICIPTAYVNIVNSVIYFDIREAKEGVSIDKLTTVFE
jgi:Predicted integral membrane protein